MRKRYLTIMLMLFCSLIFYGQLTDVTTYDFTDGTIVTNGQSTDGSLVLGGTYSTLETYGLDMKADGTITINITGSNTIRFTGSTESGLEMTGSAASEGDLGTSSTTADTYDFVYGGVSGTSESIEFTMTTGTGDDLYLPQIEVIPAQAGGDVTVAEENIIYYFDLRDGSIVPSDAAGNTTISDGLFTIECGPSYAYGYNGSQHGIYLNDGNVITLEVAGDCTIKLGGSTYSKGTITASSEYGTFDTETQNAETSANFATNGTSVEFNYEGEAGTVSFTFGGSTSYLPYIEVLPVPEGVDFTAYEQKTGTIEINGTTITYTSGATASEDPVITLSSGTVISTTADEAFVYIDLGGSSLSSLESMLTGDISSVDFSDDENIQITLADADTEPYTYTIKVMDSSITDEPVAGTTYTYNFYDGSVLPQDTEIAYDVFYSEDRLLTLNSNNEDESYWFYYHDSSHGAIMYSGTTMDMKVAGDATISIGSCPYTNATDAVWKFTNTAGDDLGSIAAYTSEANDTYYSFSYTGEATTITATLYSESYASNVVYVPGVIVANDVVLESVGDLNGKTAVWDFGAEQLDETTYLNRLTENIINAWYPDTTTVASINQILPDFTSGELNFVGGGSDRLRTSNTALTRYDGDVADGYTGRLYVNSSADPDRYIAISLSEDDEVSVVALSQNGYGELNFASVSDPAAQTDTAFLTSAPVQYDFVAKTEGVYHLYDTKDKPSYYRIYRTNASYATVTGTVDVTAATDIPESYAIIFTNEAGKTWTVTPGSGTYEVSLPIGYSYSLSLADANGYIISTSSTLITDESTETLDLTIEKVTLNTLTGYVTGLGENVANLTLLFTPVDATKIYEPEVTLTDSVYSVELEPDVEYIVSGTGVNDYEILSNTITIVADSESDVEFSPKLTYAVSYTTLNSATQVSLTAEQLNSLQLVFTNKNEDGYFYTFGSTDEILLRDGAYYVTCDGLAEYPLELSSTTTVTISGEATTLALEFDPVSTWSFDENQFTASTYKGLLFSEEVTNDQETGYLEMPENSTITVPISTGQKLRIVYYCNALFTINGETTEYEPVNSTGTKTTTDTVDYVYSGEESSILISISDKTDFTSIQVLDVIPYSSLIYVGEDKEYTSINDALDAIQLMDSRANRRVSVMIDPGNYEEMLVIKQDSISLVNASESPSIELANNGVNINENAVRITSYYGYGYNYYSMGDDQKWNEDVLASNKANGSISYENQSGTTNGSYWNATVVVQADGFEAENIIFENSFNQYISHKESQDVVEEWSDGDIGDRPTDVGDISVQDKSYVERAAAFAIGSGDKTILNNCRIVGHQDAFYGQTNSRVAIYKGVMMGGTDYIFGGMVATFYQTDFALTTTDNNNDVAYITAAQQSSGRGYLMYECNIISATPGTDISSEYDYSKPGYFGRPWQATTSEVVFYKTNIAACKNASYEGQSLIEEAGWLSTLNDATSAGMCEYQTTEEAGVDNAASRASWATTSATGSTLSDGTVITPYNFTKGEDEWDPFATLTKTYAVTLTTDNSGTKEALTAEQLSALDITFTNVARDEVFVFNGTSTIELENGTYVVTCSGIGRYPIAVVEPDNLIINGAEVSLKLDFDPVYNWLFDEEQFTSTAYKGLLFSTQVTNDSIAGHIVLEAGTTVSVPVSYGKVLEVVYYNAAAFTIGESTEVYTTSNSTDLTSTTDTVQYVYTGTGSSVDIDITSATYIKAINEFDKECAVTVVTTNSDTNEALTEAQLNALEITFTNIEQTDSVYTFMATDDIKLIFGTYAISCDGLDDYPLAFAAASDLTIDGSDATISLSFDPISSWSFDEEQFASTSYNGLLFSTEVTNNQSAGNAEFTSGTTISVPISYGEELEVVYFYAAGFTIANGEDVYTTVNATNITTTTDTVYYVYTGVDDYINIDISSTTYITNINVYEKKYKVGVTTENTDTQAALTEEQLNALEISFTKTDDNTTYTFMASDEITLGFGTYAVSVDGLDDYPLALSETSDLIIDGADATLALTFNPVSSWSFDEEQSTNDSYRGLLFSSEVTNDQAASHVGLSDGTAISVPITYGQTLEIVYYYSAGFTIDGGTKVYSTSASTGSMSTTDTVKYIYTGSEDYVDIDVKLSTTYITNIRVYNEKYNVNISTRNSGSGKGLTEAQLNDLEIIFTDVNNETSVYTFNAMDEVSLVEGTYAVTCDGIGEYPLTLVSSDNLMIDGSDADLELVFESVSEWSFDDVEFTAVAYKGLLFSTDVSNDFSAGSIGLSEGTTISVPIESGQALEVVYYYSAGFTINGETKVYTTSNSTASKLTTDTATYVYTGEDDYVDIAVKLSTTYITNIKVTEATYGVTVNTTNSATGEALTADQLSVLDIIFTDVNDENNVYRFDVNSDITLDAGTYSVSYDGLGDYALAMAATSNLTIDGAAATLSLVFNPVSNWSFDDVQFTATSYEGLLFSTDVTNDQSAGNIGLSEGTTISVPIESGQELEVVYYYSAGFTIDGGTQVYTTSNSTGSKTVNDTVTYVYTGEDDYIDIDVKISTTYITNIKVEDATVEPEEPEEPEIITYGVTVSATNISTNAVLTDEQLNALEIIFTNIDDAGDVYQFGATDDILLPDGTYEVSYDGLGNYSLTLTETSNLVIDSEDVSLSLVFESVSEWSFDDIQFTATSYEGLLFSTDVTNDQSAGNIGLSEGTTISVPITAGQELEVVYYYSAGFTINGESTVYTTSNSTASRVTADTVSYVYTGENDYIDIDVKLTTTYITSIRVDEARYNVSVSTLNSGLVEELSNEQLSALEIIFTNVDDEETSYQFNAKNNIELTPGTYAVACDGLGDYALRLTETSDLVVVDKDVDLSLVFDPVTEWSFDDIQFTASSYEGLLFSTDVTNEVSAGYIGLSEGTTVSVPVDSGQQLEIVYYYSAVFTIDGGTETYTTLNSTASRLTTDTVTYVYTGLESYVDIDIKLSTSYITNIKVSDVEEGQVDDSGDGEDNGDGQVDNGGDEDENGDDDGTTTGVESSVTSGIKIYAYENKVIIEDVTSDSEVYVYNLSGNIVKSTVVYDSDSFTLPKGYYIVKLIGDTDSKTVKVLIK